MQAVLKIHTLLLVLFEAKKYNGSCQRCRYGLYNYCIAGCISGIVKWLQSG